MCKHTHKKKHGVTFSGIQSEAGYPATITVSGAAIEIRTHIDITRI